MTDLLPLPYALQHNAHWLFKMCRMDEENCQSQTNLDPQNSTLNPEPQILLASSCRNPLPHTLSPFQTSACWLLVMLLLLASAGGFDETLSDQGECGITSDWEICHRMWIAGWQVRSLGDHAHTL